MDIYNYDGVTGEFLSKSTARNNPLEKNKFLIPANATKKIPPALVANKTPVFDGDKWVLTPDHRKDPETYYSKSDGSIIEFELGNSPDATMQKTFPANVQAALDEAKRVNDIKTEAVNRMGAILPGIGNLEHVEFISEMWKSIDAGSRSPTANFQKIIDIYAVAKAAIVDGATVIADIVWP